MSVNYDCIKKKPEEVRRADEGTNKTDRKTDR